MKSEPYLNKVLIQVSHHVVGFMDMTLKNIAKTSFLEPIVVCQGILSFGFNQDMAKNFTFNETLTVVIDPHNTEATK